MSAASGSHGGAPSTALHENDAVIGMAAREDPRDVLTGVEALA